VKNCPNGPEFHDCSLHCKLHTFDTGQVQIYSWELRCLDCGWRSTIGYRSDDADFDPSSATHTTCPFCALAASGPGKDMCVSTGERGT
jgi:hypothetical protein